jgi:hypothetical protein
MAGRRHSHGGTGLRSVWPFSGASMPWRRMRFCVRSRKYAQGIAVRHADHPAVEGGHGERGRGPDEREKEGNARERADTRASAKADWGRLRLRHPTPEGARVQVPDRLR